MKHFKWVLTVAAVVAFSAVITSQTPSGHAVFEQALAKERVEGNLPEAIRLYERVVTEFASDRALAAQALVQVGLCYEKLGRDEAIRAYERLVRDFADQAEPVAQARGRLAALKRTSLPPASAMTVQPLAEIGGTGLLAVTPDGTKAIVWDFSKGQNLALYDFTRKQVRLLTELDWLAGWTDVPRWSVDGRRVSYAQAPNPNAVTSEIRVLTLDGQSSVVYRTAGIATRPVGWTPDGRTLVIVDVRSDKTWAIGTLPAAGGRFTPLRSLGWSDNWRNNDGSPRLSPDGRFVAYLEGETGLRDVHVLGLNGREAYRITDHPGDDFAPIWSPDSRHLAFKSNRLGSVSLWTIEVKDGRPVGQPVKLKDGMQSAGLIDWTERGLFYNQRMDSWDLFTMPMDRFEGRPTGSPRAIPYSRTGRNVSPAWSPDGRQLAFVSSAASEPNRRYVVVMPADGGQPREFLIPTATWEYTQSPYDLRWFGDGRGLGFSGHSVVGAAVFRLVLETGEWQMLPLSKGEWRTRIEWNRDGSAFYFMRQSGNAGLFERAVSGDAERVIHRSPPADIIRIRALQFSPDRRWLAFSERIAHADTTGNHRILVTDVATGETRAILVEAVGLNDSRSTNLVSWTPSGDLLVERSRAGGAASETLIVPLNGGAPRSITIPAFPRAPGETQQELAAKWSPDGRSMVLERVNRGWETFVIENPLAAMRTAASR